MNPSSGQLYLRLLDYVKPYWCAFAISLLGMVVVAATEPLVPALMKPLLDGWPGSANICSAANCNSTM